jgi:hypothetical protein
MKSHRRSEATMSRAGQQHLSAAFRHSPRSA